MIRVMIEEIGVRTKERLCLGLEKNSRNVTGGGDWRRPLEVDFRGADQSESRALPTITRKSRPEKKIFYGMHCV